MARTVTATDAKAHLLALLDEVGAGEEVEITRHGRLVARLVPARRSLGLRDRFAGTAWTSGEAASLFDTGEDWLPDEQAPA